jgi:two-component system chemotaxis response regulator CheB
VTALRVLVAENTGDRRLTDAIAAEPSFALAAIATSGTAAIATSGTAAIALTQRLRPDAIVMASNIAGVDACAAVREIMALEPTPIIVALDDAGADNERTRLDPCHAGAVATVTMADDALHRAQLVDAISTFVSVKLVRLRPRHAGPTQGPRRVAPDGARRAGVVAIAASTGGPSALHRIFSALPENFAAPILVTQHITAGFSDGMVVWLDAAGPLRVKVAEVGERLRNATAYFPPDGRHLTLSAQHAIVLSGEPPDGGHRPSANPMFRSAAGCFGGATCAVILTGMGRDGVDGLADVRRAGGTVYAQDQATCAVFGMPKAAVDAGVVDRILPLDAMARQIARAVAP